jgi:hypothetical protein
MTKADTHAFRCPNVMATRSSRRASRIITLSFRVKNC